MTQISTAGRLLNELAKVSTATRDAVIDAAGIDAGRADAASIGALRLTLSEQLRLSEASARLAPTLMRAAFTLRGQALAARAYEEGAVAVHSDRPAERWERSAQLRR
jgi:hypothetical protein